MQIHRLDPAEYYPLLDERQPPSLVIFTAPACGACRRLLVVIDEMAPIAGLDVFVVSAERAAGLIEELEIFHLPAIFLYRDGDLHAEIHAILRPDSLRAAIESAQLAPPAVQ